MSVMATDAERAAYLKQARATHDALPVGHRDQLDESYRRMRTEGAERRKLAADPAWNDPDWTNR